MMRSSNIQTKNFSVYFYSVFDFLLLFFKSVLMDFNQTVFIIHFLLHLDIVIFNESVINFNL